MKTTLIQPYLFFGGRCEEALEFYRTALGAEVDLLMHYKDSPDPMPPGMLPPGFEDKVMHATFRIAGNILMASDGCHVGAKFEGFSLSLAVPTEAEANRAFAALDPCRKDGDTCTTGIDCCGGFCTNNICAAPPPPMMGPPPCAHTDEKCSTDADCCNSGDRCISGFCGQILR